MREARPLAGAPDAAAKARAKDAGRLIGDIDARRIVFVDGTFVPELSDLQDLSPGLTIRSMAQALASGDPLVAAHLGKVVRDRARGRGRAQHRADARRRAHSRRQGRDRRAADASGVCRDRRQAGLGVHPLAGRDRAGRARHDRGKPRRGRGPSGQHRARTRRGRQGPCRSHQDHRRAGRSGSRLVADGGGRRARAVQRFRLQHRRRRGAQPAVRALRRRGHAGGPPRREPAQGQAARRHHAGRRSQGAAAARAARCSPPCSTARAAACSRARSSCGRMRRRPTPR